EMSLTVGERSIEASFGGWKLERIDWIDLGELTLLERPLGTGRLLLSPLPVELSDNPDSAEALYREAARIAGVATSSPSSRGLLARRLRFPAADLWVLVNESAGSRPVHVEADAQLEPFLLPPGRAALRLVERRTGRLVDGYPSTGSSR
ncbi:MAG: hypothetical protein ACREIU_00220, partial [Planctomycetota bacterium]